jgi:hypothetical protein
MIREKDFFLHCLYLLIYHTFLILQVDNSFILTCFYSSLFVSAKRSCYVKTEIHITVLLCWHETNIHHVKQGKNLTIHFSFSFLFFFLYIIIFLYSIPVYSIFNNFFSLTYPSIYILKLNGIYMAVPIGKQSVKC